MIWLEGAISRYRLAWGEGPGQRKRVEHVPGEGGRSQKLSHSTHGPEFLVEEVFYITMHQGPQLTCPSKAGINLPIHPTVPPQHLSQFLVLLHC